MPFRSAAIVAGAVLGLLLAGCGGAHLSAIPAGSQPGTLRPQLNGGTGSLAYPTLYVAGQGAVFAYDLGAAGDTPPVTRTTGYYYQAGGPNGITASIGGIATNASGDLVIAQNFGNPQGDGNSCQLLFIPARSGTSAADAVGSPCSNGDGNTTGVALGITFTQAYALTCAGPKRSVVLSSCSTAARGPSTPVADKPGWFADEIDVLMRYQHSGNPSLVNCYGGTRGTYEVDRYWPDVPGTYVPVDCVPLGPEPYVAIAGSTNDAFFVDFTCGCEEAVIDRYDVTDFPTNEGAAPGSAGPLAVAANLTANVGYRVVATTVAGITTIYSFKTAPLGGLSLTHALGTFTNPVGALAVDNNGTIYVGVNQPNGVTKIKVYGPSKTQATNPDYILNNPVRRPNPAASPGAVITGIAIAQ